MSLQTLNSAQLSLAALQESDKEAFQRLLTFLLKNNIDPTGFQHSEITQDSSDPNYALTQVSVDRRNAHISLWAYQDSVPIRYRRVSLQAVKNRFGNVIRADLPTTKAELLRIFLTGNGLADRGHQVVDGEITELGAVSLDIQDGCFLLYGTAEFTVKPYQRALTDVLEVTTIAGFRLPEDFIPEAETKLFTDLSTANNASLPYPLESEYLRWGNPEKISGYRYDNTRIQVEAFGDGYYLGTTDIVYTRYDFGWSTGGAQFLVTGPSQPTTSLMIAAIAAETGLPITLDDVVIENYDPVPSGELVTLTVFFKEDCLRYTGELTVDYRAV